MDSTPSRIEERNKAFLKNFDADEIKKRRDDNVVELRKKKRLESLVKRSRNMQDSSAMISFDPSQVEDLLARAEPQLKDPNISSTQRILLLTSLISHTAELEVLNQSIEILCKIASSEHPQPLSVIWESGISQKLIEFLSHSHNNIKYKAAWILTNLSSKTSEICNILAEQGAIESLAKLCTNDALTEYSCQGLWALSNISGDNITLRNRVLATGIGEIIIRKLNITQNIELNDLSIMIWLLSNLFKFKPQPSGNLIQEFVRLLPRLLILSHEAILIDTLRSLTYITALGEHLTTIFNTGFIGRIVMLLIHDSHKVKHCALNLVSNLSNGDELQIKTLLDNNVVDHLFKVLLVNKTNLKKDALFAISNIVLGPWEHVHSVTGHKEFKEVVSCIEHMDRDVRVEALFVLDNASNHLNYVLSFVEADVLEKLLNIFTYGDPEIILKSLGIVEKIFYSAKENNCQQVFTKFEELGGTEKMERLQSHPNPQIYEKVFRIIHQYFNGEVLQNGLFSDTFTRSN